MSITIDIRYLGLTINYYSPTIFCSGVLFLQARGILVRLQKEIYMNMVGHIISSPCTSIGGKVLTPFLRSSS